MFERRAFWIQVVSIMRPSPLCDDLLTESAKNQLTPFFNFAENSSTSRWKVFLWTEDHRHGSDGPKSQQ